MMKTVEAIRERAQHWASVLPSYSAQLESERRLPEELSKQFSDEGFYSLLVPVEYGGFEIHPRDFVCILKTLAEGDGSAAWNVMIAATTGLLSASLPEEFSREIYAENPGVMTVGVTAPNGKAEVVAGGYEVSGVWPFGSGSQNADWICGGSFILDQGQPRLNSRGEPELHLMMFESSQVQIKDTWHVSGLKGTGSHHFEVQNQFVPEGRSVILGTRARIDSPLYRFPLLGLLALGVCSVSLGIGHRAVSLLMELATAKKPTGSARSLAHRSAVQSDIARSLADLGAAEAFIYQVIDEAWSLAEKGDSLTTDIKARLRLAAVNCTDRSVAAVDRMYQVGGGTSIYEQNPLQQCFRDIHVTTQHMMVASPVYEVAGRVALGMDPKTFL